MTVIDLFCGAGGFSKGFLMTKQFEVLAGVDIEKFLAKSFMENHPGSEFVQYDIRKDVPDKILGLNPDIVIGSPPCQGFSDARGVRYRLDRKNDLVFRYFAWIDQIRPKIAIMENVKGMSTIGKAWRSLEHPEREEDLDFMDLLAKTANNIGYSFSYRILNSKDFGVPQERERVFCIMVRNDLKKKVFFPAPTHGDPNKKNKQRLLDDFIEGEEDTPVKLLPAVTIGEALEALPRPLKYENGIDVVSPMQYNRPVDLSWFQRHIFDTQTITNHIARFPKNDREEEIIKRIPEGKTYRSDRLGDKHIGVWDVFNDQLSKTERQLLRDLAKLRTKNHVKTRKGRHSEGYVPLKFLLKAGYNQELVERLVKRNFLKKPTYCKLTDKAIINLREVDPDYNKTTNETCLTSRDHQILEKLRRLQSDTNGFVRDYQLGVQSNTLKKLSRFGWIETGPVEGEYDLTAKAGHRGKYSRLDSNTQSRTLMTGFTNLSEILHPTANRGLSLREGARLMSFPDSFTFYGTFSQISLQIGNAVAPLVAKTLASIILDNFNAVID